MSLWRAKPRERRDFAGLTAADYIRRVPATQTGPIVVDQESAMRHSAVWACLRLRADLMSTFPMGVYRDVTVPGETEPIQLETSIPSVLVEPGGEQWDYIDWMYASQYDLDRVGNAIGLITERSALGLPLRIDLQQINKCSVLMKPTGKIEYRIEGKLYPPDQVWHERQFPVAGVPVGLSPLAYAAWTIGEYLSIQDFALKWFSGGAVPKARMKNTAKKLNTPDVLDAKQWYKDTINHGDLLVHGSDWEYSMIQAEHAGVEWLDARRFGLSDVSRFFGCPSDLIDASVSGQSITYANISERNLQFLIMHLGPAVVRREHRLSKLLPTPRYVVLHTDELLRMDPKSRAEVNRIKLESRQLAPSEVRAQDNLPPYTEAQKDEFKELFVTRTERITEKGAVDPLIDPAGAAPASDTSTLP